MCTLLQITEALICPSERQSQQPELIIYFYTFFPLPEPKIVFSKLDIFFPNPDMFFPGFEITKKKNDSESQINHLLRFKKKGAGINKIGLSAAVFHLQFCPSGKVPVSGPSGTILPLFQGLRV